MSCVYTKQVIEAERQNDRQKEQKIETERKKDQMKNQIPIRIVKVTKT